jgi:hypothetical protein
MLLEQLLANDTAGNRSKSRGTNVFLVFFKRLANSRAATVPVALALAPAVTVIVSVSITSTVTIMIARPRSRAGARVVVPIPAAIAVALGRQVRARRWRCVRIVSKLLLMVVIERPWVSICRVAIARRSCADG